MRLFQKYSAAVGWRFEVLEISDTDLGGCREASAHITGSGVYGTLKYESGVHRVCALSLMAGR